MPKRPRDANQLAKMIVDISTSKIEDVVSDNKKDAKAQGRPSDLKGE